MDGSEGALRSRGRGGWVMRMCGDTLEGAASARLYFSLRLVRAHCLLRSLTLL
jgi:hypothetical protein